MNVGSEDDVSKTPSPSTSHSYETIVPSASNEPDASSTTGDPVVVTYGPFAHANGFFSALAIASLSACATCEGEVAENTPPPVRCAICERRDAGTPPVETSRT